jgi:hypothetical protein
MESGPRLGCAARVRYAGPSSTIDIALRLSLLDAVLPRDLGHEIILALERGKLLSEEFTPPLPDLVENDFPGICGQSRVVPQSSAQSKLPSVRRS